MSNPKDYNPLYLKCYICKGLGHVALDCEFFFSFEGNLISKKHDKKRKNQYDLEWPQERISFEQNLINEELK